MINNIRVRMGSAIFLGETDPALVSVDTGAVNPAMTVWATSVALIGTWGVLVGDVDSSENGRLQEIETNKDKPMIRYDRGFSFTLILPGKTSSILQESDEIQFIFTTFRRIMP
jgi:hypothetical protein